MSQPTATKIRFVEDHEAKGDVAAVYDAWKASTGRTAMPGILKCFSARPDFLEQVIQFSNTIHFSEGHLSRRHKEMLATAVSAWNHCPYWVDSHAHFLRVQEAPDDVVHALAQGRIDAPSLTAAERELLAYARKLTEAAYKTTPEDVQPLRNHAWTEQQIAEAVYIIALFAFFNRVADAFGIPEMGYLESEKPR